MGLFNSERMSGIATLIAAKKAYADEKVTNYIKKICANLVYDAAMASPQWSGDYASNWSIVTDGQPYYNSQFKVNPWTYLKGESLEGVSNAKQRGDDEAVDAAVSRGMKSVDKINWKYPVYLVNATPIAAALEAMEVNLRPVNRLTPEVSVISFLKMKYRCIP